MNTFQVKAIKVTGVDKMLKFMLLMSIIISILKRYFQNSD